MNIQDARYNRDGLTIDCFVEHPELGVIPYTASPDSTGEFPESVWAALQSVDVAAYDPPTDAELLASAQASALAVLNADYEAAARPLLREYPNTERLSWSQQQNEATAYQAWLDAGSEGDAPATPALSAILGGRNGVDGTETLADLVAAVLRNAEAFIQWQTYTGIRQRGEWAINAATTADEALAVTWESLTAEAS